MKKMLPIIIGALLSIPLAIGAFFYTQGALTRANTAKPEKVKVNRISDTSAVISWTTDQESQGVIEYGTSPTEINKYAPEIVPKLEHSVELTLLTPKTPYYFSIKIGTDTFDNDGVPWTFTTKAAGEKADVKGATDQVKKSSIPRNKQQAGNDSSGPLPTVDVVDEKIYRLPESNTTIILQEATPTPLPTKRLQLCPKTSNCNQIKSLLGKGCSSSEYVACIKKQGSVQGASTQSTGSTGSTHRKINTASPTPKPTLAVPETAEE